MKKVDLDKSIFELTEEYPEIIDIMKELGFKEIANPIVRRTAGKTMKIPMGCKMRGIELEKVAAELKKHGFEIKS